MTKMIKTGDISLMPVEFANMQCELLKVNSG